MKHKQINGNYQHVEGSIEGDISCNGFRLEFIVTGPMNSIKECDGLKKEMAKLIEKFAWLTAAQAMSILNCNYTDLKKLAAQNAIHSALIGGIDYYDSESLYLLVDYLELFQIDLQVPGAINRVTYNLDSNSEEEE